MVGIEQREPVLALSSVRQGWDLATKDMVVIEQRKTGL